MCRIDLSLLAQLNPEGLIDDTEGDHRAS